MKGLIVTAVLFSTTVAFAERRPYPVRIPDNKAVPDGYNRSGGYAIPKSDNARQAIPRRGNEPCPHGFNGSGGSCLSVR